MRSPQWSVTLGCLDRPTHGSYLLDGHEVVGMSREQRARIRNQQIGFVFQNFNLLARTSALENVELPLLYGPARSSRQRRKIANEMLDLVGLADRLDHHPGQLSGGQQQRVAIARAVIHNPNLIVCDEPTSALDQENGKLILTHLREIVTKENKALIVVTHDSRIFDFADRIVHLEDGSIIKDGYSIH